MCEIITRTGSFIKQHFVSETLKSTTRSDIHSQTQKDEQQMIQRRMKKIQETEQSEQRKTLPSNNKLYGIALGVLLVAVLIILPKQYTLSSEQLKKMEEQAEDLIKLKQEITELEEIKAVERLDYEHNLYAQQMSISVCMWRLTGDPIYFIKLYASQYNHFHSRVRKENVGNLMDYEKGLTLTKENLDKELTKSVLKFAQNYAVDLTLDPDTANPCLILSDDGKQVSHGDIEQDVPENTKRFDKSPYVLAKQGFSSGSFYYEVQVKGKTEWILGVARESINRKEDIIPSPEDGVWAVILRNENQYSACENPSVLLSLKVKPEKVGVFVDYEEGLVSFFDVDSRSHIHTFTGQTLKLKNIKNLYPLFDPGHNDDGKNSNPLIITPVSPVMN